jgi:hypothetical protein
MSWKADQPFSRYYMADNVVPKTTARLQCGLGWKTRQKDMEGLKRKERLILSCVLETSMYLCGSSFFSVWKNLMQKSVSCCSYPDFESPLLNRLFSPRWMTGVWFLPGAGSFPFVITEIHLMDRGKSFRRGKASGASACTGEVWNAWKWFRCPLLWSIVAMVTAVISCSCIMHGALVLL